jgi:hypothetical protein
MPNRSKGRGQTKSRPWSSRLALDVGLTTPPLKNLYCYEIFRAHRGGHPHGVVTPVKMKKKKIVIHG